MTTRLRRAGAFAAVSTLALAVPSLDAATAVGFGVVAALAAFVIDEGPLFELFARPGDRRDGRLNGLAGFALAAATLALLSTVPRVPMPAGVFAAAVLVVAFGNLGKQLVRESTSDEFLAVAGFVAAGFAAATLGQAAVAVQTGGGFDAPQAAFLAAVGALVAALLRAVLFERDDPLVILSAGLALWLFAELATDVSAVGVAAGLAVTLALGYVSYALGTASVAGMLTGVLLGLLTIVLGGFGWFAVLVAFFAIGGLASKYRLEEKKRRGVAEENEGARGSSNVLGNSSVALLAVIGFAAAGRLPVGEALFAFAFAGSVAAAMSDTLSSELGGLFDDPRLVTTFEPVPAGTDGAVTWQGELAGATGAVLVGGLAAVAMPAVGAPLAVGVVAAAGGLVGMHVDSLLGAVLEGGRVGNQTVNFLATLSGAVASAAIGLLL